MENKLIKVKYIGKSSVYLTNNREYYILDINSFLARGIIYFRILDNMGTAIGVECTEFKFEDLDLSDMVTTFNNKTIVTTRRKFYDLTSEDITYSDVWEEYFNGNMVIT